jgi:hypothetical protein
MMGPLGNEQSEIAGSRPLTVVSKYGSSAIFYRASIRDMNGALNPDPQPLGAS